MWAMRKFVLSAMLMMTVSGYAQVAVQLPAAGVEHSVVAEKFSFVSDGPTGPGWTRPDEIARAYFHDNLAALFERTIILNTNIPARTRLSWIFTGPHAGFTVELSSSKVRVVERYYDSMGLYENGNYPNKVVRDVEQPYTGEARKLTVVADSHLAVSVFVNGMKVLETELLFDVTRHQLMYSAPRSEHDVVEGALLKPETKDARIAVKSSDVHQTMLGFGGSPSIPAYMELSDAGKKQYWEMLKHYNLLLDREYPMGTELKHDLSNLENLADATPHYYGDNFPNGEVSSFEYSRHVLDMGGDLIYEMWALPAWATETYDGPRVIDAWGKVVKKAAKPEEYARIVVGYCQQAKAKTGAAPLIVGIENEVEQPPAVFNAMVLALRRALDNAGFAATKIHMADASYMFYGVERAKELRKDPAVWKAIDYTAVHEYDFQEFMANPDIYDERMHEMHAASDGKSFLATEICFNDPKYQEPSYRIAFQAAQLYYKNLTELDAVALMYCWLLLDVEEPTFGGSRALIVPDKTNGGVPIASSFELRVLGAFSRHVLKGMKRLGADSDDNDLQVTAFGDSKNETVLIVNRASTARKVSIDAGLKGKMLYVERTGLSEANVVTAIGGEIVVEPGQIMVLSTLKAE
jgi:O-glycosyl hydrolase